MINQCIVEGLVTRDPRIMGGGDKKSFVSINLKHVDTYKIRNTSGAYEVRESQKFFDVSVFGDTAERAARDIKEGDVILVSGKVAPNMYVNAAGEKKYSTRITANEFTKISGSSILNAPSAAAQGFDEEAFDGDISL